MAAKVTESEVRERCRKMKGDNLHIVLDEKTSDVKHAEIHKDNVLLWKWPEESKTRIRPITSSGYGPQWKLSLKRPDYEMLAMEKSAEV
jgi:hypothetical protein